jgi:hypothetical protein
MNDMAQINDEKLNGERNHDGKTFALTNQWGRHTIRSIDNLIAAFPDVKIPDRALE